MDVFKAVTVSDEELKSVALQYRAYGDRTESWRRLTTNTPSASSAWTRKHVNEDGLQLNFKVPDIMVITPTRRPTVHPRVRRFDGHDERPVSCWASSAKSATSATLTP